MPQESIRIGKAELSAFVAATFVAVGLKKEHADAWADMLVWANLRGTDSHGIIRIPRYIDLKREEWADYRVQVTPWELDRYLAVT